MTPPECFDHQSETRHTASVVSRRDFLIRGSSVLAALALSDSPLFAQILPYQRGRDGHPFSRSSSRTPR